MSKPNKCIIDNWSLEHAGILLDNSDEIKSDRFLNNIGGLSNFINALFLYEESFFLANGFESHWTRFKWFAQNSSAFISGLSVDELPIAWKSAASYKDQGIENYLLTTRHFGSDLLVSPERATKIIESKKLKLDITFIELLQLIDNKIQDEKDKLIFRNPRIGIDNNFRFPSLTQYVLSQASNREDLLKVIMQLKSDGKINRITKKIEEFTSTIKGASKLQQEVDSIVKKEFGNIINTASDWQISFPVYFLTISKSINLSFFNRKEYLIFLKNLIACRTEAFKFQKDIKRVFKQKID